MLQNQIKSSKLSSEQSFPLYHGGLESNPTQNSCRNAMTEDQEETVPHLAPPPALPAAVDHRKRTLSEIKLHVPLDVSLVAVKRRRVVNMVVPTGIGQSIPLKKASWWKIGGKLPRTSLAKESTPLVPVTTAAAKAQNAAFVSSESLPDYIRAATLAQRYNHAQSDQNKTNNATMSNHDQQQHQHKKNHNSDTTTSTTTKSPAAVETGAVACSHDISSFVRRASTGKHQIMLSQAALQNEIGGGNLVVKPPHSAFANDEDDRHPPDDDAKNNSDIPPAILRTMRALQLQQQQQHQESARSQTTAMPQSQGQHPSPRRFNGYGDVSDDDGASIASGDDSGGLSFRAYQAENWTEKFEELIEFRQHYGHCLVPNCFPENAALAQWVKRQRYQYKLKVENKRSAMSEERVHALEEFGFIWDSHRAIWDERLHELMQYKQLTGHCNVPSRYARNRQLAVWVKRQRRQYKFFTEDKPSSMTVERVHRLEAVGFEWDLRKVSKDYEEEGQRGGYKYH